MAEIENSASSEPVRTCRGIVKAVTDGNRIIVRGPTLDKGLPQEKIVIISSIKAPSCGKETRKPGSPQVSTTDDQPGAFFAKEYVRKMLIGKVVKFSIEHEWDNMPQVAGNVWLDDATEKM